MYEKNGIKYYSPNESFEYPKIDTSDIPTAMQNTLLHNCDYICPNCEAPIPIEFVASDEEYTDNGKTYPVCCNESLGFNGWGDYHDWEEIHSCPYCHKEFIITNGCF